MEVENAIEMVNRLVMAVYWSTQAERERYGGTTATWKEQETAVADLLRALLGRDPSDDETAKAAIFRLSPPN